LKFIINRILTEFLIVVFANETHFFLEVEERQKYSSTVLMLLRGKEFLSRSYVFSTVRKLIVTAKIRRRAIIYS